MERQGRGFTLTELAVILGLPSAGRAPPHRGHARPGPPGGGVAQRAKRLTPRTARP